MKFAEIIKRNLWPGIELVFLQLYPKEKKNISGYEMVFSDLKLLSPTNSDITLVVDWAKDDFDQEDYVDVSGYENHDQDYQDDENHSLALEFTSWDQWLGMNIDEKSIKDFSESELISHCLFEMTFYGFNQEEIQKEADELEKIANEIDHMTEEEKKTKLKSWEDVKKELGLNDEPDE